MVSCLACLGLAQVSSKASCPAGVMLPPESLTENRESRPLRAVETETLRAARRKMFPVAFAVVYLVIFKHLSQAQEARSPSTVRRLPSWNSLSPEAGFPWHFCYWCLLVCLLPAVPSASACKTSSSFKTQVDHFWTQRGCKIVIHYYCCFLLMFDIPRELWR